MFFKLQNIVAKADVWRYTILLNEGGVYLDIDSQINKSLSNLVKSDDKAIITAEKNKDLFVQWALIFEKGHPILSRTLENIITAVREEKFKHDHHSLTVKTYASSIFDLSEESGNKLSWDKITTNTDSLYELKNSSFRIFGVDYNNYFTFQHKYNHELRGRKKGEVIAILDADISVEPETLSQFFEIIDNNYADFVNGSRLIYEMEEGAMRSINKFGNRLFQFLISQVTKTHLTDSLCGTKVFKRELIEKIFWWQKTFNLNDPFGDFDMIFTASYTGQKVAEYPVKYKARTYGKTQISRFKDGYKLIKYFLKSFVVFNTSRK